jgi:hypothetical protein
MPPLVRNDRVAPLLVALMITLVATSPTKAQKPVHVDTIPADSLRLYAVRVADGTTVVGRVDDPRTDPIVVHTDNGTLSIPRARMKEMRALSSRRIRKGEYWPPSPNETRLLFAPTGRMLKQGEGYYANTYVIFQQLAGGITPRFTLGGGMSIIPTADFSYNVFYITPKFGVYNSERINVAIGLLAADIPADRDGTFGIAYGVSTWGTPDAHVTVGAGVGYAQRRFAQDPVFMIGGEHRVGRRVSLITENYIIPTNDNVGNVVSYGLRFFGDRLSVDLALLNTLGESGGVPGLPGIPYVAFAVKF